MGDMSCFFRILDWAKWLAWIPSSEFTTIMQCWPSPRPTSHTYRNIHLALGERVCWLGCNPANTKHLYNICTTSVQHRRRWANIVQVLYKSFVFAGKITEASPSALAFCRLLPHLGAVWGLISASLSATNCQIYFLLTRFFWRQPDFIGMRGQRAVCYGIVNKPLGYPWWNGPGAPPSVRHALLDLVHSVIIRPGKSQIAIEGGEMSGLVLG